MVNSNLKQEIFVFIQKNKLIIFKVLLFLNFTYKNFLVKFEKLNRKFLTTKLFFKKIYNNIQTYWFIKNKSVGITLSYIDFRNLVSVENLYKTFIKLKFVLNLSSYPKNLKKKNFFKLLQLKKMSEELIRSNFIYPKTQWIRVIRQTKKSYLESIFIQNFKTQILQKIFYDKIKSTTEKWNYNIKHFSIHTLLKQLKMWNRDKIWILNGSIYQVFKSIHKNRLKNIFLLEVNEVQMWTEIKKMFKNLNTDHCSQEKMLKHNRFILFLFDIYLNEFDKFFNLLFRIEKRCTNNFLLGNALLYNTAKKKGFKTILIKKISDYKKVYIKHKNSIFRLLWYLRYVNNFLIVMENFRNRVVKLKNKIFLFLRSNLHLNIVSYTIINRKKAFFLFLNFKIYIKKKFIFKSWLKYTVYKKWNLRYAKSIMYKIKKKCTSFFNLKTIKQNKRFEKWNITRTFYQLFSRKNEIVVKWESYFQKIFHFSKKWILFWKVYYLYYINFIKFKNKNFHFIFSKNEKLQVLTPNNLKKTQVITVKLPFNKIINYFAKESQIFKGIKIGRKNLWVINLSDIIIINYYTDMICNLIYYYRFTENFNKIKKCIETLRCNCHIILSKKHRRSFMSMQKIYKKHIKLSLENIQILSLPSSIYVFHLCSKYIIPKIVNFNLKNFMKNNTNLNNEKNVIYVCL